MVEIFVGWLFFALWGLRVGLWVAERQEFSRARGGWYGILLGPFFVLFFLLRRRPSKRCARCAEFVHVNALVCRYCGRAFEGSTAGDFVAVSAGTPTRVQTLWGILLLAGTCLLAT